MNENLTGPPWSSATETVCEALESPADGLSDAEVSIRLKHFGPNRIVGAPPVSLWVLWFRQFRSLVVALLGVAAAVSAFIGDWVEAGAVVAVVLINALIGFFTELKATRSMEALKKLGRVMVRVIRGGVNQIVPSSSLVPGDRVILEAGDIVPADMRLIEANLLKADESSLTGESLPIRKGTEPVEEKTPLADRKSMLFRGSKVTAGTGKGLVTATGERSELGKISEMVSQADRHSTPLEKQLDALGLKLIWVTLVLTVMVAVVGISLGRDAALMIQTAIALAVAAIPEGLPVVATIALAHGLMRMAERNALINQLSAVETLGSTGIICTDKTGTLTENRMTVSAVWPVGSDAAIQLLAGEPVAESVCEILRNGVLCNNAQLQENGAEGVGDPLEVALLEGGSLAGIDLDEMTEHFPRTGEVPFDAVTRIMATIHKSDDGYCVAVKGAPEAVIEQCRSSSADGQDWEMWEQRNEEMASRGLRVIAMAEKCCPGEVADPLADLSFLGLVGMIDPPRADVPGAIQECLEAGVEVVMITGDQAETAKAIARRIGLEADEVITGSEMEELNFEVAEDAERMLRARVIARATPVQKLQLVRLFQSRGEIVAMTGDGVNDAPALKQADIGIAMGLRGTDVAREASAMVLRDDAFPSIVAAIKQGRVIFSNIRKFVAYLISCNLSEILVIWLATLFTANLPILPLQILFLNLVTDVFPALALGVTQPQRDLLGQAPRKRGEPVLRKKDWVRAVRQALAIAGATLGAFFFAIFQLGQTPEAAVTISFLTLAIAQLFHVFNMADRNEPFLASSIGRNRAVWIALGLCFALLAAASYHPLLSNVLHLRRPDWIDLQTVLGFAILPVLLEIAVRLIRKT